MKFVNRIFEMKRLEKEYDSANASFVVIYGRRRVGKTRLIEEFIKGKKGVYYLAAQETDLLQIKEFKNIISGFIRDEFLAENNFADWKSLFLYLEKVWPKNERIILAIDEVTFIIKENPSFVSYLQRFWDTFLSKTHTCLILSGSIVGLIIKTVLSYESPLFGRRTCDIKLEEFNIREAILFMKDKSLEEQIRFYSVTGGVAKYLLLINGNEGFYEFLNNNFFNKEGFFYREGLFLMSEEFREPATYINILKAIAFGNTKLNEISNYVGIDSKRISSYLDILIGLNLVEKKIPVTKIPKEFRGAIYLIKDNYLIFWFRFVHKRRSDIEMRKDFIADIKNEINAHTGKIFEKICSQIVLEEFNYSKAGNWWHKDKEIDIVALKNETKEILFCECKWQENVDAEKLLEELKEKAKLVEWNNETRKEKYALFAKSFKTKTKQKNVFLYDLKELERTIKKVCQ